LPALAEVCGPAIRVDYSRGRRLSRPLGLTPCSRRRPWT